MWNEWFSAGTRVAFSCLVRPGLLLLAVTAALAHTAQAATTPTVTTLALSAPTVASGAPVTLTATVTAGGAAVTTGSVTFCDASATACQNTSIVGTGQLNGTAATVKIIPAIGVHSYKAIFNGKAAAAASTSATQTLIVTGKNPTSTSIVATGNLNGYGLTATVVGVAGHPPLLSGTVSFEDTTNKNYVLATAPLSAPTFAQSFIPAPGSPVSIGFFAGSQPAAGGTGDFNGDGKPDLAIMDSHANSIYILLGNEDGTFTQTPSSPIFGIGATPCVSDTSSNCSMTVGDFNHDGYADLAETSGSDNTVIVLLGNGDGSFKAPASITVGTNPQAVTTGDFNNDGLLDLAVANANDNTVSILVGNGDGTFTPGSTVPVGNFPFFLAVADFNRDGFQDIAVTNDNDDTVSILLGNGDGTFTQAPGSPIPNINSSPCPVVAADFNGDGIVDLAVANFYGDPDSLIGDVVILLGNGDGTFTPAAGSPVAVGEYPFAMAAGDFNEDGQTDLAVANYGDQTLTLLLGKGDGTFTSAGTPTPLGASPNDIVLADFNGDGTPDLAIPNLAGQNTTILLDSLTQTETASVANFTIPGTGTHYVDAVYPGSTYFAPSTSATIPLQGQTVASTLTLSVNPAQQQQLVTLPVTFTAQVATSSVPPPPQGPTGTVSFFNGAALLGTAAVNAAGQAVYTTSSLADGTQSITASYSGDASYLASTAAAVTVTISDLQIARTGTGDTPVLPGTTVVYTLQVTPQVISTFLYQVTFTTTGLPIGANVAFSPATLPAGGSAATVTMTVTTAKNALNEPPPGPYERLPLAFGLLLPLWGAVRMRKRMLGVMLLAVLSLSAVVGLNGCSGAGLFAARKVNYSITVIANEGNASGTLQRSTQVPLAIQ